MGAPLHVPPLLPDSSISDPVTPHSPRLLHLLCSTVCCFSPHLFFFCLFPFLGGPKALASVEVVLAPKRITKGVTDFSQFLTFLSQLVVISLTNDI